MNDIHIHCSTCGVECTWPMMTCPTCAAFHGVVGFFISPETHLPLLNLERLIPVGMGTFIDLHKRVGLNHHGPGLWSIEVDLRMTHPSTTTEGMTA